MAYMVRLGIWGIGTSFRTFEAFLKLIEKRSVFSIILYFNFVRVISIKFILNDMTSNKFEHFLQWYGPYGAYGNSPETKRYLRSPAAQFQRCQV